METLFSQLAEGFDLPILQWISQNLRCGFLDAVMPVITLLGDAGIFWIAIALVLLCIPKYRRIGIAMGLALIMGLLICNLTIKPLFARIRPYDYLWEHYGIAVQLLIPAQHDFSFPSGHTAASFEAATALVLYRKKWGIPALILAALIAFSRLYLFVHYPTDVVFSVGLGILLGWAGYRLTQLVAPRLKLQ